MQTAGIIWSDDAPENVVKYHTLQKSKENEHFATFFNGDLQAVHLKESDLFDDSGVLKTAFLKNDYSAFFILAELNWYNHALTDFYGIKLAQQLRLNNVKAPIFLCSFMPEELLINQFKKKILSFRGHYFIRLPEGFKSNHRIEPLDDFELDYCKTHLCDVKGAIRDIYHTKQHALNTSDIEQGKAMIKGILSEIQALTDLPKELLQRIQDRLNEVEAIKMPTDLNVFIKQDESVFMDYFSNEGTAEIKENIQPHGKWEILILDDVPADVAKLIAALKSYGFNNQIHFATSYDEAVQIINKDKSNHIAVVISDYRLEEEINGIKYLKGRQGYSFVEWLSKQDRLNEIFVFSGLARSFLKSTFKRFNIRVNIMSKYESAGSEKTNELAEEIIEKGNQVYEAITNLPSCKGWDELKYYYCFYRNHSNYQKFENEINTEARNVINQIVKIRDTAEKLKLNLKDLTKIPFFSKIKTFPNLTGRLCENIKGTNKLSDKDKIVTTANRDGEESILSWRDPLSKKPDYMKDYFINKLIARRIAWWLLFCEGLHPNTVYSLLMNGEFFNAYFRNETKYDEWILVESREIPVTNDFKTLINTRLAVVKEDFPNRLLIEERNWFKYDMNTDLDDLISVVSGYQFYFYGLFEEFLPLMNQKRPEFNNLKMFISGDRFVFHSSNDIRKSFELTLNCLDNYEDKRKLIYEVLKRIDDEDKICAIYFNRIRNFAERQLQILKNR